MVGKPRTRAPNRSFRLLLLPALLLVGREKAVERWEDSSTYFDDLCWFSSAQSQSLRAHGESIRPKNEHVASMGADRPDVSFRLNILFMHHVVE